jgi:hypothetical protein
MLFLLILSFHSGFEWVEVEKTNPAEIFEVIKESPVAKRYGELNLEKWIIHLTSDIFGGGCKIILSKGTEIRSVPEGLKIYKRAIKMKKFDRYSALYEKGELKREWEKLERESTDKLRNSSLLEDLSKILSEERCNTCNKEEERINPKAMEELAGIEFPSKTYYSFIEIEEEGNVKLIPVVLELCPLADKIGEYMNNSEGG